MRAISTNAQYRVYFETAAGSYILEYQNTGGNWINEGAIQSLRPGILVSSIILSGNKANFYSNSTSLPGSITLANAKGFSKTVTLGASTGRVYVQ